MAVECFASWSDVKVNKAVTLARCSRATSTWTSATEFTAPMRSSSGCSGREPVVSAPAESMHVP